MAQRKQRVKHFPPCRNKVTVPDNWFSVKTLGSIVTVVTCTVIGANLMPALMGYPDHVKDPGAGAVSTALMIVGSFPGFIVGTVLAKKIEEM